MGPSLTLLGEEAHMKKRSVPTLLYVDGTARRWAQAAIGSPDADLLSLCVCQWKRAASLVTLAAQESARTLRVAAPGDVIGARPPNTFGSR